MSDRILQRLKDHEDSFVERKSRGVAARELRKTIVAFANSVPEGCTAVLFIGVHDNGTIFGAGDTDSHQKTISEICKNDCYPPITGYSCQALSVDGKDVIAVEISASQNRPHFAGPAYVRHGSQTVVASEACFNELIDRRNSKVDRILRDKDRVWRVVGVGKKAFGKVGPAIAPEHTIATDCKVIACDTHMVTLERIDTSLRFTELLRLVDVSYDHERRCPRLEVRGG